MHARWSLPLLLLAACSAPPPPDHAPTPTPTPTDTIGWNADTLIQPGEKHFVHLKQLTFGGDNAEAYWSFGGDQLSFQAHNKAWGDSCDQIYTFHPFQDDLRKAPPTLISVLGGRTTCSYFLPGDSLLLFASTHLAGPTCPPVVPHKHGDPYIWSVYDSFDIFVSDRAGHIRQRLTDTKGYDAEGTVSPKGDRMVFTSVRDGDLDLYTMKLDGSDVKRITNTPGYDGGAFFSPDGSKLVWRASRPGTPQELKSYRDLLKKAQVQPTQMELFVANADGSDARQITHLGQANWAPSWHPDGHRIIFASNHTTTRGFPFTLFMINSDGTGLEQITYDNAFDAFPLFSKDGRFLVFSSNRGGKDHETNLFLAEWKD